MAGRGRGRGRGFGRGQPFPSNDQLNPMPTEKVASALQSPYPVLEFYPAQLSTQKDYDDQLEIRDQMLIDFQTSNYHLKQEDENLKLFSSGGEKVVQRKAPLDFHWDFFPLELRPIGKQNVKKESVRNEMTDSIDLTWLDKLEKKEEDAPVEDTTVVKPEGEVNDEEGEAEEFEEELDLDTDYMMSYFDDGEDFMDENNDADQEPYF